MSHRYERSTRSYPERYWAATEDTTAADSARRDIREVSDEMRERIAIKVRKLAKVLDRQA